MKVWISALLIYLVFGCCKVHAQVKSLVDFADAKSRMDNFLLEVDALSKESAWTFSSLTALEVDNKPEFVEQISGFVMENPAKKISYSMVRNNEKMVCLFGLKSFGLGRRPYIESMGIWRKLPSTNLP